MIETGWPHYFIVCWNVVQNVLRNIEIRVETARHVIRNVYNWWFGSCSFYCVSYNSRSRWDVVLLSHATRIILSNPRQQKNFKHYVYRTSVPRLWWLDDIVCDFVGGDLVTFILLESPPFGAVFDRGCPTSQMFNAVWRGTCPFGLVRKTWIANWVWGPRPVRILFWWWMINVSNSNFVWEKKPSEWYSLCEWLVANLYLDSDVCFGCFLQHVSHCLWEAIVVSVGSI